MNRFVCAEKVNSLVDAHCEHVANRLAFELHRQRFGIEARAVAHLAAHFHVGEETHFNTLDALSFARRTASAAAGVATPEFTSCGGG